MLMFHFLGLDLDRESAYQISNGFTLAELLISLALLGLIATFTIPKLLQTQQHNEWNARAKEDVSMVVGAYQLYRKDNPTLNGSMGVRDLTPYFNFARTDTSGDLIDRDYGNTSLSCDGFNPCFRLHNGSTMHFWQGESFGGTANTNAVAIVIDPDSIYSGSTTGDGKSVVFLLYTTGRITSIEYALTGTATSGGGLSGSDPPWFSW